MDLGGLLSQLGSMVKASESVAAANFLDSVATALPTSPMDPGQQAAFVLAFHAAVATFIAQSAAALPADAAAAVTSVKALLQATAASLRAQAAK